MSTYSSNLRLELIGTGEQQGTWGATTNTNLGTLLEQAITGYASITVSDGGDTTLTTNNGSSDQARNMTLNLTGTITAARNVICPSTPKVYIVKNATTGGFAVTFKVSGQTGVSIPNGATYLIYVNGTDAIQATGTVASGGTGTTTSTGTGSVVLSASPTLTGTPLISTNKIDAFPSGTKLLFQQTSAPTGWTKDTSNNDKALRVVSGTASTGGTTAFSTVFASRTPAGTLSNTTVTGNTSATTSTGTVGDTTLTSAQIPAHQHFAASTGGGTGAALSASNYVDYAKDYSSNMNYTLYGTTTAATIGLTSSTGGGGSHTHTLTMNSHTHTLSADAHTHTFTGTAMDFAVQYVDVIIATKD